MKQSDFLVPVFLSKQDLVESLRKAFTAGEVYVLANAIANMLHHIIHSGDLERVDGMRMTYDALASGLAKLLVCMPDDMRAQATEIMEAQGIRAEVRELYVNPIEPGASCH